MNHPNCNACQFINVLSIIATIALLTITSCNRSPTQDTPKEELPKALEDKSSSYQVISKSRNDDLLESLYSGLLDKTPELKQFENSIVTLRESKSDSTSSFYKFNTKNQAYFSSANSHIEQIQDSVLRSKMKMLISNSILKYTTSIRNHNAIIEYIKNKEIALNDLHTILKITRTLPLIEKYQTGNLPSAKPLEGFASELNKTVQFADTLSKN